MLKKLLKSPWSLALMPVFLGAILTAIYDAVKNKPVLSTLLGWIKKGWRWIVILLNFELKISWILIGVSVIFIVLFFTVKFASKNKNSIPDFVSYKEDAFGGWKWSWDWRLSKFDGKWYVDNLRAHCPKCSTPMFHDGSDAFFKCPRCDFQTDYTSRHKGRKEVEAIIIDNLDRKKSHK